MSDSFEHRKVKMVTYFLCDKERLGTRGRSSLILMFILV